MLNKDYIDKIVEEANNPEVIQSVGKIKGFFTVFVFKIERWMVIRVIEAIYRLELSEWVSKYYEEWKDEKRNGNI